MEIETATQIVTFMDHGYLVKAVALFRQHTKWGLLGSKDFLQDQHKLGSDNLFNVICLNFTDKPEDLLILAKAELVKMQERVETLEAQVSAKYDIPVDSIDELIAIAQDGTVLLAELFLGGKDGTNAEPNHSGLNNNVEY